MRRQRRNWVRRIGADNKSVVEERVADALLTARVRSITSGQIQLEIVFLYGSRGSGPKAHACMQEYLLLFACSVQILRQPLEPRAIERQEHGPNVDPGWQRAFLFGHEHEPSGGDREVRFLCWLKISIY